MFAPTFTAAEARTDTTVAVIIYLEAFAEEVIYVAPVPSWSNRLMWGCNREKPSKIKLVAQRGRLMKPLRLPSSYG